jgi:DNA-directed RNA polymerase subunit K/omega
MSDYEDYEDYDEDESYDYENDDKSESESLNNDEKEQYIDGNDKNIEDYENDELEYINEYIILNSENINTIKNLTLYEYTSIIGQRAQELYIQYKNQKFMPLVDINKTMINEFGEIDFIKIAKKELVENKISYYIKRSLQNNKYVIVDTNNLILKEKY